MNKATGRKKGTVKSLFHKHDREVEVIKTSFDKLLLSYTSYNVLDHILHLHMNHFL